MVQYPNMSLEKFPVHIHGRLRVYLDRNMGGPSDDPYEHFDEWWNCRCDLGIFDRFHWLLFRLSFYRRDGLHVSFTMRRNDHINLTDNGNRAPTSGGQYHWVSEWSPPRCQRFLSYIVGWLCFTGWQCASEFEFLDMKQHLECG